MKSTHLQKELKSGFAGSMPDNHQAQIQVFKLCEGWQNEFRFLITTCLKDFEVCQLA